MAGCIKGKIILGFLQYFLDIFGKVRTDEKMES